MQGDPVTRPYADLSLLEIVKRGETARKLMLFEKDPFKRQVYARQYRELQEEWRFRNAKKAGDGQ